MKRSMFFWSMLMVLGIFLVSCEDDNNSNVNWNFEYPLTIGSSWEYDKTFEVDFDEDCEAAGFVDEIHYGDANVQISGLETILDTLEAYNFETVLYEEGNQYLAKEYYNEADNHLICYAYEGSELFTPKDETNKLKFKFNGKLYDSVQQIIAILETGIEYNKRDSLYFDPVNCYEYPLELNKQWTYRTSGNPWRIEKKIIGKTTITVPAGSFDCWEIRWTHPESSWNDDLDFRDFVSEKGLIKRHIGFTNGECYMDDELIGYFDTIHENVLTDYELVEN